MQVAHDRIKSKKKLQVKYLFVDCEQSERRKRLDDAFDYIFNQIEEDENHENGHENSTL